MAKTSAISELQQQIEDVRREAFAAGYGAAMQAIRELASRPFAETGAAGRRSRGGSGRGRRRTTRASTEATSRRTAKPNSRAQMRRRSTARRPERGANAQRVEEILRTSAPQGLRIADIRKALQEKGTEISFTSLRHALSQLEKRNAAEQVGDSRTWRHRGGAV